MKNEKATFLQNFHPDDPTNLFDEWMKNNPTEKFIEPSFRSRSGQWDNAVNRRYSNCPYRVGPPVGVSPEDTKKLKDLGYEGTYVIESKLSPP